MKSSLKIQILFCIKLSLEHISENFVNTQQAMNYLRQRQGRARRRSRGRGRGRG